jgi:hypothetical protein
MVDFNAEQLTSGASGGSIIGHDCDKIAFYGYEPVVQPTSADQAAVDTPTITDLANDASGTDIATAVNALIAQVAELTTLSNALQSALVSLGLIKGE